MSTIPTVTAPGGFLSERAETAMVGRSYKYSVNESHLQFLSSPEWARMLETDLLPWVEAAGELGDDVLEIGPGPGLTTDLLRQRVPRLTAVEVDASLAVPLQDRMARTNVEVLGADATAAGLESGRFSAATCFSVLHHMPSAEDQDRLFAEVYRVLRPGGIFVGADSRDLEMIRAGHAGDTFVPVAPDTLAPRLEAAGFVDTTIDVGDYQFRFVSRKARLVPAVAKTH
jgi:SAM-dependent methyltransferase